MRREVGVELGHALREGLPFAGTVRGQFRLPHGVAPQDEALRARRARWGRRRPGGCGGQRCGGGNEDFAQRLIEEFHLERAVLQQGLDLRLADGGDVVQPGGAQFLELWAAQHAPIAHQRDVLRLEALLEFGDLRAHGLGVRRVAREGFQRHRHALVIAEQADHDLFFAALAIAVIAERRQLIVRPFQVGAGHIIEIEGGLGRGAALRKEVLLNGRLPLGEPGEIGI